MPAAPLRPSPPPLRRCVPLRHSPGAVLAPAAFSGTRSRRAPSRSWPAFGESGPGLRSAWLHGGSDRGCLVSEVLKNPSKQRCSDESEEKNECRPSPSAVTGEEKQQQPRLPRERRQKGADGAAAAASLIGNHPDLLAIPGVGPRNMQKLVDKGIGGVDDLKQLYKDQFIGEPSQKMVDFLQSSVGIIHRNHAESITSFIKESVDEELKEEISHSDVNATSKKRLTFCVEGNISVGKTTFLQRIANETLELRDLVEVVPEPISKWQDVGPDHFNILDAFYADPERYAYTFQNYVFVTRVMQERESAGGVKPLRLMERSVFSDRMDINFIKGVFIDQKFKTSFLRLINYLVFVRAVHEAKWMNEMEISIYDSWFDPVVSCMPGLIPDGFIYLRASPDTCHNRLKLRKRAEEGGVTLDYLRDLHEKHENWLFPFQRGNHGVLSVSQLPLHMDYTVHPDIRDRVPALVLDCEPNIDFSKDVEAKQQYARQVAEFFEFVKQQKEVLSSDSSNNGKGSNPQVVMMPHQSGLWVPQGNHFPESALKSLDFRRAMSSFISEVLDGFQDTGMDGWLLYTAARVELYSTAAARAGGMIYEVGNGGSKYAFNTRWRVK
ncbi:hypothetical protein ACLOJK_030242 [Asimina triloba]